MRSVVALAFLLAAGPAIAQTPLTGSTGEPTTNTPPLAGTAVAPGPAAGPGTTGTPASGATRAARARGDHAPRVRHPLAERFNEADTDHDGSLTLAEARAAKMGEVVRDFGLIDKDKKGTVTLEQIQEFRRERRAARAADEGREPAGQAGVAR